MTAVIITYRAPEDDAEIVRAFGYRFIDDEPTEVELSPAAIAKVKGNPHFEVLEDGETTIPPGKKRGKPQVPDPVTIDHDNEGGE